MDGEGTDKQWEKAESMMEVGEGSADVRFISDSRLTEVCS